MSDIKDWEKVSGTKKKLSRTTIWRNALHPYSTVKLFFLASIRLSNYSLYPSKWQQEQKEGSVLWNGHHIRNGAHHLHSGAVNPPSSCYTRATAKPPPNFGQVAMRRGKKNGAPSADTQLFSPVWGLTEGLMGTAGFNKHIHLSACGGQNRSGCQWHEGWLQTVLFRWTQALL